MRNGAWKNRVLGQESGFTLIEALLAVVLIAIIATVAVTQYTDFTVESKHSATRESLALLRNGLQKQHTQMKLRCGLFATTQNVNSGYVWPTIAQVNSNDITTSPSVCVVAEVPDDNDRYFVAGAIPANPWSHPYCTETERRTVITYQPIAYIYNDIGCRGITSADSRTDDAGTGSGPSGYCEKKCGWVYDHNTGIIKTGTNYAGEAVF